MTLRHEASAVSGRDRDALSGAMQSLRSAEVECSAVVAEEDGGEAAVAREPLDGGDGDRSILAL